MIQNTIYDKNSVTPDFFRIEQTREIYPSSNTNYLRNQNEANPHPALISRFQQAIHNYIDGIEAISALNEEILKKSN